MRKISEDEQIKIFQHIFFILLEIPSMRDYMKSMIDARERVDTAEVNLMLAKLATEVFNNNKEREV